MTGWIWSGTRKIHLYVLGATLFSWLVLGVKYGLGYCFLTDWHWNIKYRLGQTDLPYSFIKYLFDKYTPFQLADPVIDNITLFSFLLAILITVYINFVKKAIRRHGSKSR